MEDILRVTFERMGRKMKLVFVRQPYPEIGDVVTLSGEDWTAIKLENTKGLSIPFAAKRKRATESFGILTRA